MCDPRKPAPPVTREVGIAREATAGGLSPVEVHDDLHVVVSLVERLLPPRFRGPSPVRQCGYAENVTR